MRTTDRSAAAAVRRYLKKRKLSIRGLAKIAGLDPATISRVLNGQRLRFGPHAALAIATATLGRLSFEECCRPPEARR